jgi:hypothetical protein
MQLFIFCIIYCKGVPHRTPLLFWARGRACVVTTKDSGYNETITLFWIEAIAQFPAEFGDASILSMINCLLILSA